MAANITLSGCKLADAEALARNNIPAFWADPNWVLSWKHRTLEYHISQIALRVPRNLVSDREVNRHQKAVDADTGSIVGYARWCLPPSKARLPDGRLAWPEALGPEVGEEEEGEIRRVAEAAVFDPNQADSHLTDEAVRVKKEILARQDYMVLDYLAVHPDNQRKGIATTLVKSGIEQAEKLELDIFVYAKQQGAKLYKALGFKVEWDTVLDDTMYGGIGNVYVALMVYEHKPKSAA